MDRDKRIKSTPWHAESGADHLSYVIDNVVCSFSMTFDVCCICGLGTCKVCGIFDKHTGWLLLQALGCLLYFLMYSKLAFQPEAKLQILNGDIIIPPSRPPPLVELLRELLVVSPQRRPDIRRVLRRLQEVAELLNIDPALLIPSTPTPRRSGATFILVSLA